MSTPEPIHLPLIPAATLLDSPGVPFVDLRSPTEFAEDHLPGALHVPLFDDLERELIGTLYAQRSPEEAFEEGRARTKAKVQELVTRIAEAVGWDPPRADLLAHVERLTARGMEGMRAGLQPYTLEDLPAGAVVLGCWRGGLRSRSVVALLRALGLEAVGLEGGYRAYRARVREDIAAWSAPPCFVLRGLTGVGKTLVLQAIERMRPGWTVDLEDLAGHRSSILGMVGREPCSQRTFESRLRVRLAQGFPGPCVFEGESRKVGNVILPEALWRGLTGGRSLELVASVERRVDVLLADYLVDEASRDELARQLPFIEQRLGSRKWDGVLVGWLTAGEPEAERRLVEVLLERYYDPLYRRSESNYRYELTVDTSDPERAARCAVEWIDAQVASAATN